MGKTTAFASEDPRTSLTAKRYKIGLISCLVHRIWKICSDESSREEELKKLKVILQKNQYPNEVIEKTIQKYEANQRNRNKEKVEKPEIRFLKLPYVSNKCENYAFKLKNLIESNFPQVEFNVAFTTPLNIGKLFPFKDNTKNVLDKSHVVYNINCSNCETNYIGMSKRILSLRVKEHQNKKATHLVATTSLKQVIEWTGKV